MFFIFRTHCTIWPSMRQVQLQCWRGRNLRPHHPHMFMPLPLRIPPLPLILSRVSRPLESHPPLLHLFPRNPTHKERNSRLLMSPLTGPNPLHYTGMQPNRRPAASPSPPRIFVGPAINCLRSQLSTLPSLVDRIATVCDVDHISFSTSSALVSGPSMSSRYSS